MDQISGRAYWRVNADKNGGLDAEGNALPAAIAAAGLTDVFVLAHGWGNTEGMAESLYQDLFSRIAAQADQHAPAGALSSIGFVGVFWPALWFPDPPASGHAASLAAAAPRFAAAAAGPGDAGPPSTAVPASVTGAQIAADLAPSYAGDDARLAAVTRIGELIDAGQQMAADAAPDDKQQTALEEFHPLLSQLVTAHPHAVEDSGEFSAITAPDPAVAYAVLADTMGSSSGEGNAQDVVDRFHKIWDGAKDAVRVASYYEMKCRAGDIGRAGLGPLLERIHTAAAGVRVHLIGHSFGARLVSFALAGISSPDASPVASLSLVQGAFSHWSFAASMPFGSAGALAGFTNRVHGPLVATFSIFDWAVGRWYPKASLLTNQNNQSTGILLDQWGGMGGDGFRGVSPAVPGSIAAPGASYSFQPGTFHPIDSHTVIDDVKQSAFSGAHSDIRHDEVAWLIVAAATGA